MSIFTNTHHLSSTEYSEREPKEHIPQFVSVMMITCLSQSVGIQIFSLQSGNGSRKDWCSNPKPSVKTFTELLSRNSIRTFWQRVEPVTSDSGKLPKRSPVWNFKETSPNLVSSNWVTWSHMLSLRMETFCRVQSTVNCFYGKVTW